MKELMKNLVALQVIEFGASPGKSKESAAVDLRAKIPPQILAHYDRLMARGKKGVAAVNNQVCTACHMKLTLGVINTLKRSEDIQLCESCGRYLYLPEGYGIAPVVPEAEVKPKKARRRTAKTSAA
jgi:hypothetical protein